MKGVWEFTQENSVFFFEDLLNLETQDSVEL